MKIEIDLKEYIDLRVCEDMHSRLVSWGVDNWAGWEEANEGHDPEVIEEAIRDHYEKPSS